MKPTNTNVSATAVAEAPVLQRVVVHTRNEEDRKVLLENFDPSKMGRPTYISGLTAATQIALAGASAKGIRIVTTGLPLDTAANLGKVTVVRAWDKTNEQTGTRTRGCQTPVDYFAGKVKDSAALAALRETPAFKAAFESTDLLEEGEDVI